MTTTIKAVAPESEIRIDSEGRIWEHPISRKGKVSQSAARRLGRRGSLRYHGGFDGLYMYATDWTLLGERLARELDAALGERLAEYASRQVTTKETDDDASNIYETS